MASVRARLHSLRKKVGFLGGRSFSSDIKVRAFNGASAPEELFLAFFRKLFSRAVSASIVLRLQPLRFDF
jgi:hypothetical protein